ncbi:hypothetical protein [Microbacterium hominis]|uniref:hypothetical protein n=1 Tax=Microbacterium hominis TaxID=162426 RepID=UPI000768715C|nr:hypothetical protein [Microbacterium hominis]KXC05524.1 hypothetical protein MhomT_10495 [Microbacterium hominis]
MTAPRFVPRTALVLLLGAAALGFAGCAAAADVASSPSVSGSGAVGAATPTGSTGDPGDGDGGDGGGDAGGGSAPSVPTMALADVLGRYPDCAAMGSLLGSALDGLEPNGADNDGQTVQCDWISAIGDDVNNVSITVTTNNGAVDVAAKDDIAAIGSEYVADAALEARGGIAWLTKNTGDLRIFVTNVDVPGLAVAITSGALNQDPRISGGPAVAAAKQLLGIAG